MAYCVHCRNFGQPTQSVAIFSGSHGCGTIEKPRRTKCAALWVKAHSVEKPSCTAQRFSSSTMREPKPRPRQLSSTTSERTSATARLSGASSAQPTTASRTVTTRKRVARRVTSSAVRGSR